LPSLANARQSDLPSRQDDWEAKSLPDGQGARAGISRAGVWVEIPVKDARALMKLRVGRVIKMQRYVAQVGKHRFEIAEFEGDQAGLSLQKSS
jgi:CYTH domain-containing protein